MPSDVPVRSGDIYIVNPVPPPKVFLAMFCNHKFTKCINCFVCLYWATKLEAKCRRLGFFYGRTNSKKYSQRLIVLASIVASRFDLLEISSPILRHKMANGRMRFDVFRICQPFNLMVWSEQVFLRVLGENKTYNQINHQSADAYVCVIWRLLNYKVRRANQSKRAVFENMCCGVDNESNQNS